MREGRFRATGLSDRNHANIVMDLVKALNNACVEAGDSAELLISFDVGYGRHGANTWPVISATISRPLVRGNVPEPTDGYGRNAKDLK